MHPCFKTQYSRKLNIKSYQPFTREFETKSESQMTGNRPLYGYSVTWNMSGRNKLGTFIFLSKFILISTYKIKW